MSGCYIIFSKLLNRFYIGATHHGVDERLEKHNVHIYGRDAYTAKATDWELYLFIPTQDFKEAGILERKIKSMKSTVYIRNLRKYPELIEKLKSSLTDC